MKIANFFYRFYPNSIKNPKTKLQYSNENCGEEFFSKLRIIYQKNLASMPISGPNDFENK